MLLRGQVPEDLLEFYPEIEKTVRKNQSKKREEKKKQGQKKKNLPTLSTHTIKQSSKWLKIDKIHLEGHWVTLLCNKDQGISPA